MKKKSIPAGPLVSSHLQNLENLEDLKYLADNSPRGRVSPLYNLIRMQNTIITSFCLPACIPHVEQLEAANMLSCISIRLKFISKYFKRKKLALGFGKSRCTFLFSSKQGSRWCRTFQTHPFYTLQCKACTQQSHHICETHIHLFWPPYRD